MLCWMLIVLFISQNSKDWKLSIKEKKIHILFLFVFSDMLFIPWALDTTSNTRLQQKVLSTLLTGVLWKLWGVFNHSMFKFLLAFIGNCIPFFVQPRFYKMRQNFPWKGLQISISTAILFLKHFPSWLMQLHIWSFRESRIASVGLCVINTSRRGYPPEDGAHIALRK